LKIPNDSPNRPFVSKEPPAGKNAVRANSPQDGQVQNKPAVRGDSPLRPGPAGSADLASLLKLPPDGLSRSLIAFARFFGLPLEPKFLAALRRDALGAAMPGTTGQEAAAPGAASREAAALGAAAAADKGIKLGEKALKEYAAAIEGRPESFVREDSAGTRSEKTREDTPLLSETDPDGQGQGTPQNPDGQGDTQDGRRAPHEGTETQSEDKKVTDTIQKILEERPLLDLINRIPGKNGRWIVVPFSFSEDGVELAVSLRIFVKEGTSIFAGSLVSERLSADIRVSRLGREQRRWLISLEREADGIRANVNVFSGSGPCDFSGAERKRLIRELAAALDVPFDRVSIREEPLLFADSMENTLSSVNEEV